MLMRIVFEDDNSLCVSVIFNSMNCTTWGALVDMYPDVFRSSYSATLGQYTIDINTQLLKTAPNGYHYILKHGGGKLVFANDLILFDSSNSTTYTLYLERNDSQGQHSGGAD
jgi:hypothetical protein